MDPADIGRHSEVSSMAAAISLINDSFNNFSCVRIPTKRVGGTSNVEFLGVTDILACCLLDANTILMVP